MRSLQAKHIQISEIYNYDMLLCIIFSSNYHLNEPIMREAENSLNLITFLHSIPNWNIKSTSTISSIALSDEKAQNGAS